MHNALFYQSFLYNKLMQKPHPTWFWDHEIQFGSCINRKTQRKSFRRNKGYRKKSVKQSIDEYDSLN